VNLKAISLIVLMFPQSVTSAIRADVGVNRFFAIAVKNDLVTNHCMITKDGYGGATTEIDAIQGALASCGKGCILIVSFRTVP
jgi:hypothetical protein